MNISKKISKLRKELKLSTEDFGKNLGVTGRMVARWENNTSKPTVENLNKIKEVYGVDLMEPTVKKETVKEEKPTNKPDVNLEKSEAKGLKTLSKIISVFATIVKVLLIISIPFMIIGMIIIPVIINNTEIGDNYLRYQTPSGELITIEGEDISLSGKYTIRYKDEVTSGEIKYDILGEVVKNIKDMDKTKVIVFAETTIVLGMATIILEIIFFSYLAKLFKNISKETPFTEGNCLLLKKMTQILIIDIIITILLQFIENLFVNVEVSNKFGFSSIIVMMVIASLSYIFKYGYNLQKNVNSDIY